MGDASINGDTYQGGSGVDTFDASHFTWATNVTISLAGGFWSYSAGSEAVTGFENIWGANGLANTVETLIGNGGNNVIRGNGGNDVIRGNGGNDTIRSEEHTSELQSLMRISYAVFCLTTKTNPQ